MPHKQKMENPKLPFEGVTIEYHNKNSVWKGAELWLSEKQKNGLIEGNELRKEVPKTAHNACVLDYLMEHQEEIPEEWKGKTVCFWGTIYRGSHGDLYVRCLCWYGEQWCSLYDWLGSDWHSCSPAALRASKSLKIKKLGTKLSDTLSLEKRIEALEGDMEKIRKFLIL